MCKEQSPRQPVLPDLSCAVSSGLCSVVRGKKKKSCVENPASISDFMAEWLKVLRKLPKSWLSWTRVAGESLFTSQPFSANFYTTTKQFSSALRFDLISAPSARWIVLLPSLKVS